MISIAMIVWRVLGGVFAPALGTLGTIAKWLFASPARLLIALCVILAAWGAWEHRRAQGHRRRAKLRSGPQIRSDGGDGSHRQG